MAGICWKRWFFPPIPAVFCGINAETRRKKHGTWKQYSKPKSHRAGFTIFYTFSTAVLKRELYHIPPKIEKNPPEPAQNQPRTTSEVHCTHLKAKQEYICFRQYLRKIFTSKDPIQSQKYYLEGWDWRWIWNIWEEMKIIFHFMKDVQELRNRSFPKKSMIVKIKTAEYQRYFWLSHSYQWRNVWRWMRGCENHCKKCIILVVMNGKTVRDLTVNSRFTWELS